MSAHPFIPGSEVWIDCGREIGARNQLMISVPVSEVKKHKNNIQGSADQPSTMPDFWLEFSPMGGGVMGWMRFSMVTVLRSQVIFAGTEWRPANDQMLPPEGVWLSFLAPHQ